MGPFYRNTELLPDKGKGAFAERKRLTHSLVLTVVIRQPALKRAVVHHPVGVPTTKLGKIEESRVLIVGAVIHRRPTELNPALEGFHVNLGRSATGPRRKLNIHGVHDRSQGRVEVPTERHANRIGTRVVLEEDVVGVDVLLRIRLDVNPRLRIRGEPHTCGAGATRSEREHTENGGKELQHGKLLKR